MSRRRLVLVAIVTAASSLLATPGGAAAAGAASHRQVPCPAGFVLVESATHPGPGAALKDKNLNTLVCLNVRSAAGAVVGDDRLQA